MRLRWLKIKNVYSRPLFRLAILTREVGQADLVLMCDQQDSLVDLWVCECKITCLLCASVAICATLINIQTQAYTKTHR